MRTRFVLIGLAALAIAPCASAKDHDYNYEKGTLTEMTSVQCGVNEDDGKNFSGMILGTDSGHKHYKDALCAEYTMRTDHVIYRFRPREDKHPVLLPIGETAQFRMKKDKMLLRVPESDGKEREYVIVSMTQTVAAETAKAAQTTSRALTTATVVAANK